VDELLVQETHDWDGFCQWAESEGVGLEQEDDWLPWWNCWVAGYNAAMNGR